MYAIRSYYEAPLGPRRQPTLMFEFAGQFFALLLAVANGCRQAVNHFLNPFHHFVYLRIMYAIRSYYALKKEKDKASQARLEALRKELADLKGQADTLRAQWTSEKEAIKKLQTLREQIEQVRQEIEVAERNYDLNRAAELKHGRLPQLV